MADLTRLRAILRNTASPAASVGSVIYHLFPNATKQTLLDPTSCRSVLEWLSSSPLALYGDVVGAAGATPADFTRLLSECGELEAAQAATYAHSMVVQDLEWDRGSRNHYATEVSVHGPGSARVGAQSSAEFAALDSLTDAGYAGVDDAVAAVADLRRAIPNTFVVHSRQHARSRHAVSFRFVSAGGAVRMGITPWCLSRRAAVAVVGLHVADLRRAVVEERIIARARTVYTYATRASLSAVRDITTPALALLTRYAYDATAMAFLDQFGKVVQSTGSRAHHVAVAFAAVFTVGAGDPLRTLAEARSAVASGLGVVDFNSATTDYYTGADFPSIGVALFSRALAAYRVERASTPWGDRVNKGAMLGYVARGRTKADRNTAACIGRMEEVAVTLAGRGVDPHTALIVMEWGGNYNVSAVLAAAAVARLDVAVDVADSGVDVPGEDVYAGSEDPPHHYQLYLSSAVARNLPRMPTVEFPAGTPLVTKLGLVRGAVGGALSEMRVAYISGGVSQVMDTPVSVCSDAYSRMEALDAAAPGLGLVFSCAEMLLPPACHHALDAQPQEFIDANGMMEQECVQCESLSRALSVVIPLVDDPAHRVMKGRSMFGHNSHFVIETAGPAGGMEDTMTTIDSALACNVLRGFPFENPPPPPQVGKDLTSPDLMELMRQPLGRVHRVLSGDYVHPMAQDDADGVAASVA